MSRKAANGRRDLVAAWRYGSATTFADQALLDAR